ncbi:MAG TPA: hypothetical protein VJ840_04025 [Gemmatimonadaceae bacterium]|nr:hypothetical protein [Gemmatimonadaceae bacterium]
MKRADAQVLFVPRYEYLSAPAFLPVAAELTRMGIPPVLATLDHPDAHWPQWAGKTYPIWAKHRGRERFIDLRADRRRVARMFDDINPGLLVLSSDIGGWRVRLAVREAEHRRIPILLLLTVEIPSEYHATRGARLRKHLWWVPGPLGSAIFDATKPGDFARAYYLAVPGAALRDRYRGFGVPHDRIFETGNPAYDSVLELSRQPQTAITELTFWTEVIHETYGREYALSVFESVVSAGAEAGLRLRIRLHPREPADLIEEYGRLIGQKGRIDRGPGDEALAAPALHVAHFSTSLERAAIVNRPAISINFRADRRGRIFPPACEVTTPRDLREAIDLARADPAAWAARLESWRRGRMPPLDGGAGRRVAAVVRTLLARGEA